MAFAMLKSADIRVLHRQMIFQVKWSTMIFQPLDLSNARMISSIRYIKMHGGAFEVIIRVCPSIVRNATKGSPGSATAPWALMVKAFYSTTNCFMQNGLMIL